MLAFPLVVDCLSAEEAGRIWEAVIERTDDPVTLERMVRVYHSLGDANNESECLARLKVVRTQAREP